MSVRTHTHRHTPTYTHTHTSLPPPWLALSGMHVVEDDIIKDLRCCEKLALEVVPQSGLRGMGEEGGGRTGLRCVCV